MNKLSKWMLIASLCLGISVPAQALWQAAAWKAFESAALGVAGNTFYEFIKQNGDAEKIAQWQQDLTNISTQLVSYKESAATADDPQAQTEIARLQRTLVDTKNLLDTMKARLDKVEPRVDNLEAELAQIKIHLQSFVAQHPKEAQSAGVKLPQSALQFDINYVYRPGGQGELKPLNEGAVLHSGDHYKLVFTPKQTAFVYIFQRDSANKLQQLFPMQQMGGVVVNNHNPVQAGKTYSIPAADKSFYLDNQTGTETLYFIAAPEQDQELEAQYEALQKAHDKPSMQVASADLTRALTRTRGAAGIIADPQAKMKHSIQGDDGQQFSVQVDEFFGQCEQANGCVQVRTFMHQ